MQYVIEYMNLYPEDEVVIKGGAAAHLQLRQCGIDDPVKDVDVSIWTGKGQDGERACNREVLDRWISILPESYVHNYNQDEEMFFGGVMPPSIVTFVDQTKQELPLDVFINEDYHFDIEEVEGFNVVSFDKLITNYYQLLKDYKADYSYMTSANKDGSYDVDISRIVDKHNRAAVRLKSLAVCFSQRL